MEPFAITTFVRQYPSHPYAQMKDMILGTTYKLSLTFIGPVRAQKLNKKHRNKDYIPNVLSFPLDTQHGEICITPSVAKKEAAAFAMSTDGYIGYLFVHALLHLKGLDHGATMDKAERKYCTLYRLK